jgi:urocanate hydratase
MLREKNADEYIKLSYESMYLHVQLMLVLMDKGAITFDYGNNIRARALEYEAQHAGMNGAFKTLKSRSLKGDTGSLFPGFVPAYIRPLFCEGKGPFRWAALSGDPADIAVTDELIMNMFPQNKGMIRWMKMAKKKLPFRDCRHVYAGWVRAKGKKPDLL